MSIAGRALYRFNQWREAKPYKALLQNGSEVYQQKQLDDAGRRETLINGLHFRNGPNFKIRDGAGAAHIFYEIFLRDQYPKAMLKDAQTIVDVGANIGLFSYYARLNAPKARILAIEADPDTFAVLDFNLADQNVERLHQAAASESGAIDFYSSGISGWSSRYAVLGAQDARKVSVPSEPLSATLRKHGIEQIDFLKVDVEGAEYDILLGDGELWAIPIRNLVVEVDRSPRDKRYELEQMLSLLRLKFRSVEVGQGTYPLVTCRDPRSTQQ
jgi:FkbM family methyltransferase